MDKKVKELEKEEEIDVKKIYLRNFKPHQPRVGKEYQAIIPDCISAPKKKENKIENIPKEKINTNVKKNTDNQEIPLLNKKIEKDNQIKNEITGHKTKENKSEKNEIEDYSPHKKKKIY